MTRFSHSHSEWREESQNMEILQEFGVEPVLLAAQVVNFIILLLILRKLLYKPVLTMLENRKKTIENSLLQAEKIKQELEKAEEARKKVLEEARNNAQKIMEEGKNEAGKILSEGRLSAKKEAELILKRAQDAIASEKQGMKKELQKEVMNFVLLTTNKILEKLIDPPLQKRITKEALEEMRK